jgi:hypothetical protein
MKAVMMPRKKSEARKKYQRDYNRDRYNNDPEFRKLHISRVRAVDVKRRKIFDELIAAFRSKGCAIKGCPEKEACALVAHHTDPSTKDFNIGDGIRGKFAVGRMVNELAKCVCLCYNCHAKVHTGLISV